MKRIITFLLLVAVVFGAVGLNLIPVYGETTGSFDELLEYNTEKVRNAILERATQVEISFTVNNYPTSLIARKEWLRATNAVIFEKVNEHGISPFAGDYLVSHLGGMYMTVAAKTSNNISECVVAYTFTYYDNSEQQKATIAKTQEILSSLDIENKSDYEKVKAIYDYICSNVKYWYSSTNVLKYTAYAALVGGKSVCQGYAGAFYALAMSAGLDARIISGTDGGGNHHSWNLVNIDGNNYLLDCTWDAVNYQSGLEYAHFLKSEADFTEHSNDEQYNSAEFTAQYPISTKSYEPDSVEVTTDSSEPDSTTKYIGETTTEYYDNDSTTNYIGETTTIPPSTQPEVTTPVKIILGDVDGDGGVSAADARLTLRKAVGLEKLNKHQLTAADVDFDGEISSADARLVLRISVALESVRQPR